MQAAMDAKTTEWIAGTKYSHRHLRCPQRIIHGYLHCLRVEGLVGGRMYKGEATGGWRGSKYVVYLYV
jgi:hypothetical protein